MSTDNSVHHVCLLSLLRFFIYCLYHDWSLPVVLVLILFRVSVLSSVILFRSLIYCSPYCSDVLALCPFSPRLRTSSSNLSWSSLNLILATTYEPSSLLLLSSAKSCRFDSRDKKLESNWWSLRESWRSENSWNNDDINLALDSRSSSKWRDMREVLFIS